MVESSSRNDFPSTQRRFETTQWSHVLRAAASNDPAGPPALAELCQRYWYPLFAFVRRRGHDPADAEDAVQEFFTWLLEKHVLEYADPARGRFRGFLAAAMAQFLLRRRQHDRAGKRHPGTSFLSIDLADGETRYAAELVDQATPERIFDRAWALATLQRAMDRLREEYARAHRGERFDSLAGFLTGQSERSGREIGDSIGMTEGAVRAAVHRMKRRYGELLREEVAGTLDNPDNVEDELRDLLAALGEGNRIVPK